MLEQTTSSPLDNFEEIDQVKGELLISLALKVMIDPHKQFVLSPLVSLNY